MKLNVMVFQEVHDQWPAKNGKPGGERHSFLVLDNTQPSEHALRDMFEYALKPEEKLLYWGKGLPGKVITIGVNEVVPPFKGGGKTSFRGRIMEVVGAAK